jgi:hypothetical protein
MGQRVETLRRPINATFGGISKIDRTVFASDLEKPLVVRDATSIVDPARSHREDDEVVLEARRRSGAV